MRTYNAGPSANPRAKPLMPIVVDPQLQAHIDPLTPDEHAALESSVLAEGCRDALVLWGEFLVDGHNRSSEVVEITRLVAHRHPCRFRARSPLFLRR